MRKAFALVLALVAIILAGCGGDSKPTGQPGVSRVAGAQLAKQCPPQRADGSGGGRPGCSILKKGKRLNQFAAPPSGALFPDVSSWQGKVDWQAVKNWQLSHGWKAAAIFKMGEYTTDPTAARNSAETARLGFWRSGYWFVRPTGCGHEAGQIISAGRTYHLAVISLDIEVPHIDGYATCLGNAVRAAGFKVIIYTAPGTWPGGSGVGSAPLWQATYGTLSVFWRPLVAWQFTDGTFFAPVSIPGIGRDDVNVDYGVTKIGVAPPPPPPPPDPFAALDTARVSIAKGVTVSEHATAKAWVDAKCTNRSLKGHTCRTLHQRLGLLANRIWTVVTRTSHHNWDANRRGTRFKILRALYLK